MNERRLKARREFHAKCEAMGWDTECDTCGNGLEDPENDCYDTFCDFCCSYQIYEHETQERHDTWMAAHRIEQPEAVDAVDPSAADPGTPTTRD